MTSNGQTRPGIKRSVAAGLFVPRTSYPASVVKTAYDRAMTAKQIPTVPSLNPSVSYMQENSDSLSTKGCIAEESLKPMITPPQADAWHEP